MTQKIRKLRKPKGSKTTEYCTPVHSRKVEELKDSLEWASTQGKLLIISGPSGSGKRTTLSLIVKEKGLQMIEVDCTRFSEASGSAFGLTVAMLFEAICGRAASATRQSKPQRPLVWLDHLPLAFREPYRNVEFLLGSGLTQYNGPAICLVVVLSSESRHYQHFEHYTKQKAELKGDVRHVKFNKGADTLVEKYVRSLLANPTHLRNMPGRKLNESSIKWIVGDFHQASLLVQMESQSARAADADLKSAKDDRSSHFHIIGRQVYAKRIPWETLMDWGLLSVTEVARIRHASEIWTACRRQSASWDDLERPPWAFVRTLERWIDTLASKDDSLVCAATISQPRTVGTTWIPNDVRELVIQRPDCGKHATHIGEDDLREPLFKPPSCYDLRTELRPLDDTTIRSLPEMLCRALPEVWTSLADVARAMAEMSALFAATANDWKERSSDACFIACSNVYGCKSTPETTSRRLEESGFKKSMDREIYTIKKSRMRSYKELKDAFGPGGLLVHCQTTKLQQEVLPSLGLYIGQVDESAFLQEFEDVKAMYFSRTKSEFANLADFEDLAAGLDDID